MKADDHGTLDPADLLLGIDNNNNYERGDVMNFGDPFGTDGEPLFPIDWDLQDQSPTYEGLYSTPLSWDPPQARPAVPTASSTFSAPLNALSLAQQEKLCSIAMPNQYTYGGKASPQSASSVYKSSVSSPEGQDNGRKRKSSAEADEEDDDGSTDKHPPVKKTAHNMIEKRYRTNLNDKISALRDSVPSLRVMSKGSGNHSGEEDLQGLTPAHKLNKATVLSKATEYIKHLEKRNARVSEENATMKARLNAFEKLFMAGSMGVNTQRQMPRNTYMDSSSSTGSSPQQCVDPQGMIQIPEDMRRLHGDRINSQVYMTMQEENSQNQQVRGQNGWQQRNNGGFFGKLMVGSLAGLMIMEGFNEEEQSGSAPGARGLFAVPTQFATSLRSFINYFAGDLNILGYHFNMASLKLFMVLASLCYIFLSSALNLSQQKPTGKQTTLAPAPPLASPIHVRRKAWLTATQSVWVPRHNFFMELMALALKTCKLSVRSLIGAYGYAILTGVTEEQEAARVKAWEIALDAQLAGGDVEVSKSRLILTLLASGTLPDTPTRLMLKAVHIRVLLLQYANAGFKGFMFEELAAKLSRSKWNEAKELQKLFSARSAGKPSADPLPEHLASLLEQECVDVLVGSVVQRAWNLVWNVPTAYNSSTTGDAMNSVVDDSSIRSPLDAIAAWWSCVVLQRALAKSLKTDADEELQKSIKDDLDLAVRTSPPGSGIHVRALVARAVILDEKRGHNIATVFQFITPAQAEPKPEATLVTTTNTLPSLVDAKVSLRCAAAIAYLKRPSVPENPEVITKIVNGLKLPTRLSLLSFTAAFKLMLALDEHKEASATCSKALENLAGRLRIWIGGADGKRCGLEKAVKEQVVEICLNISRKAMGMDDAGYASMSDGEGC